MKLPTAQPGLVILFSFLWKSEAVQGQTEGQKARPCLIIKVDKQVVVSPITHTPPGKSVYAVKVPDKVKEHLGLDSEPQWIIANEVNFTDWPGYDLRETSKRSCEFGLVPPQLFDDVIQKLKLANAASRLNVVQRSPSHQSFTP